MVKWGIGIREWGLGIREWGALGLEGANITNKFFVLTKRILISEPQSPEDLTPYSSLAIFNYDKFCNFVNLDLDGGT
jgi:hypothetical protein